MVRGSDGIAGMKKVAVFGIPALASVANPVAARHTSYWWRVAKGTSGFERALAITYPWHTVDGPKACSAPHGRGLGGSNGRYLTVVTHGFQGLCVEENNRQDGVEKGSRVSNRRTIH